jgi:integrase
MARQMARDLVGPLGFRKGLRASELGGRHVNRLLAHWRRQGLSTGTIKNRMAVVRLLYARLGKSHMLLATNAAYGIGRRPLRSVSRARDLTEDALARIESKHADRIRVSLRCQRYLGLRFEESVKLRPGEAIERDAQGRICGLRLMGSWCKNGRERRLIIDKGMQRELLEEALALAGSGSLIAPYRTYAQWRSHFYYACAKAGIRDRHALRHQYAQARYTELTGRPAPIVEAEASAHEDVDLDWVGDDRARLVISSELGHGRKHIASAYLGRAVRYREATDATAATQNTRRTGVGGVGSRKGHDRGHEGGQAAGCVTHDQAD